MWRGALLLCLCLLTFLLGLGRTAIVDSEEGYYAEAGREMIASGDWITPHYNFEIRLNKPILYYWLVAGTFRVAGVSEWGARIWAALSGVGLAIVAWLVGRRWIDEGTGFVAGAIVATSVGLVGIARQALPDTPLAFFITLAIWSTIEATTNQASRSNRRGWVLLAALSFGLGLITKGPIAIALPVVAVVPLLLWERFRRPAGTHGSFPLSASDIALGFILLTIVTAPWYIAVTREHGLGFLKQFILHENLDRFASGTFNDRREPWFYLPIIAGGLLPWTAFALLWIRPVREAWKSKRVSAVGARLLMWVLGPLVLLSVSTGSQHRYILPCVVPMALLLGRSIWHSASEAASRRDVLFRSATCIAGLTLLIFGALVLRAKPLLAGINPDWSPSGAFIMIAAGIVTIIAAILASTTTIPAIVAASACATVVAFNSTVLRTLRPEPVEQVADVIRQQPQVDSLCSCGAFSRNLTFYTHLPVQVGDGQDEFQRFMEQPGSLLAVTTAEGLADMEARLHRPLRRLTEVSYVNPGIWQRPGTVLRDPDPAKYLRRVILVSNR